MDRVYLVLIWNMDKQLVLYKVCRSPVRAKEWIDSLVIPDTWEITITEEVVY